MMRRLLQRLPVLRILAPLAALLAAVAAPLAHAQSIRWDPAAGTLARGQISRLELVFEDCAPKGTPNLPTIAGLESGTPSVSQRSSFNLVNGNASRTSTVILSYPVRATGAMGSEVRIPVLNIETDQGRLSTPEAVFTVGTATVGDTQKTLDDLARARFRTPDAPLWAGQVFPLGYTFEVAKSHFYQLASHPDWNPAPLVIEDWPEPSMTEVVQDGARTVRINYRTLAMAPAAGELALQPATQLVNLNTGTTSMGFFGRPTLEQFSVTSAPAAVTVRPLPAPAPADFTGAVGDFTLTAKAVPLDVQVGEPVTWTLTLAGTGNWPAITALPARQVSRDFNVVQPQAKRTPAREGSLFEIALSEDVVLIPTRPGEHTLGPVSLTVFDPVKGDYRTLTSETFTLNVTGAPAPQTPPPATNAPQTPPEPPRPASPIPLDPLDAAAPVGAPLPARSLLWLAALPFTLPPLLWLTLALRRARQTDPARPLREARARLRQTLDQLARANARPSPELLRAWRDDAAVFWRLPRATPTPRDFPDPTWAALWAETERVLYRTDTPLSPDWIEQARRALAARPAPGFSPGQLFRRRNLFPWLALLALLFATIVLPRPAFADEARSAYAAGDFKAAGAGWHERIQKNPTDWTARHNLSLALAQRERWPEAAAHASVAWLHRPDSPATRWQLTLAANHAPKVAAAFAPFVRDEPTPVQRLARLTSPERWQHLALSAAILAALALCLLIVSGYRAAPTLRRPVAPLLILAVLLALASTLALRAYGPLLDRDTVLIWRDTPLYSVPTEAAEEQQTTTLRAGALAKVDRAFLGWRRVELPNAQTGWLRTETFIPLWTRPAAASATP